MTRIPKQPTDSDGPDGETRHPPPTQDPHHPLADAGEPVSEEEAAGNRDRDPPA
jgi:hypothetical protein